MDMKNYEENTDSKKKITFLFSPAVQAFKFKPPLLILLSENEKMTVNNVKKVILRSLDKPELGLKRVSLSTISKDKHYHLLLENCNISGMKVLNKFIYAFEISYSDKSYTCLMCNYKYVDELKLHKDCKGFVILCDKCIAVSISKKFYIFFICIFNLFFNLIIIIVYFCETIYSSFLHNLFCSFMSPITFQSNVVIAIKRKRHLSLS